MIFRKDHEHIMFSGVNVAKKVPALSLAPGAPFSLFPLASRLKVTSTLWISCLSCWPLHPLQSKSQRFRLLKLTLHLFGERFEE